MRDIKFRAWVKNSAIQEMVYPNETDTNSSIANALWFKLGYINQYPEKNIIEQWQKDIVFMQFTGLTDKNGIDIYENDILDNGYNAKGLVSFENGMFVVRFTYTETLLTKDNQTAYFRLCTVNMVTKIIGNIHENKELLKNK